MPIKADIMRALASNTAPLFVAILLLSCIGLQPHSPNLLNPLDFSPMHSEESTNSTNFTTSGGSGLAVSGEPGYVGDVLIASIMVTNSGNASGAVALVITPDSGGESFQGEHITISPGSTRQVSSHFTLLSPGTSNFDWLVTVIEGQDSLQLRGNFSVEVMPSQILNVSIDSIEWSNSEGLSFDALISLSAGKSRVIILDAYSVDQGDYQLLQSVKIDSNPGRRAITFDLGHPSAEQVLLEAIPIDWQPSSNSGNSTIIDVVEPVVTEESIVVGASFPSESPTPGSSPMVIISLENMGNYQAQSGFLRIISSSDQEILAETSVPTVMPGSKFTTDVPIPDWPASDSVGLEIQWHTNGVHSTSFYSIETENSQEGTELPFDLLAAGYGLLAGILIILLGTLVWRAVSTRTPSTSDLNLRDTKESERKLSKQEKVEIQCSYCDQRLMVPHNHSGGVRCPACSMEFVVNEEKNPEYQIASSSEDTLNCPECNQALRVKMENRPVMSRCPVCRTEFMAVAEEVHTESPGEIVKTTQLADLMGVSAASVTEMVQRLSQREMITHIPYRGCRLTTAGFQLAARVKRREGLLEVLLKDVIGFNGDVKGVACKMEHAVGVDLEETLDRLLGYPETTVGGGRIPSIERDFETLGVGTLLPLGRLPDDSSAVIELIVANDVESITISDCGLGIGSIVSVSDGKIAIEGNMVALSDSISMKILARITSMGGL